MGDSAAMAVDTLTYAFNLVAERMKNRSESGLEPDLTGRYGNDEEAINRALRIHARSKRKRLVQLELIPPLISLMTLVVVIGFILNKAIRILILDAHRSAAQQSNPNLIVMGVFSVLNLCLDFLNVFCFARAKHAMGFSTIDEEDMELVVADSDGDDDSYENGSVSPAASPRRPGSSRIKPKTKRIKKRAPAYAHLSSSSGDNLGAEAGPPRLYKKSCRGDFQVDMNQMVGLEEAHLDHRDVEINGFDRHFQPDPMSDIKINAKEKANLNMCSAFTVSTVGPIFF